MRRRPTFSPVPNTGDDKTAAALLSASNEGDAARVELLLKNGAKVEVKGEDGWSALMYASFYGYGEVVKILLKHNPKKHVDLQQKDGWSALMFASLKGHTKVVKMLLEEGANVNQHQYEWKSALMIASENGHAEVVEILLGQAIPPVDYYYYKLTITMRE